MAYTQNDLDALEQSIASGETVVQFPDGRRIEYRSLQEMMQIREMITRSLEPATSKRSRARFSTANFVG